jgi:GTPase SAR1 family protein
VKDKDFFPVVVVANKCDLEYERQVQPHGAFFNYTSFDPCGIYHTVSHRHDQQPITASSHLIVLPDDADKQSNNS